MTQYVICALQMEGFHCWPEADGELAYLKNSHRHIFFITAEFPVRNANREIEIISQQNAIKRYLLSKYVQTQTTSKRSRNFKRLDGDTEKEKNDLQAYVEAIDAKVSAGERLPGNETLTNSTLEASYLIIERLNKLLTDVQRQKAQCIKQLAELRSMSGGGKSELVDDWVAAIQAAEEMDDDAP